MEFAIAIRAAEDQLRSKPFSFCRSTTLSSNPFHFCRSETTSYLHILNLLKVTWNQWFAGKSHLSLFVSADPQMRGEGRALRSLPVRQAGPGARGGACPPKPARPAGGRCVGGRSAVSKAKACLSISRVIYGMRKPPPHKPPVFNYLRNNSGGGYTPLTSGRSLRTLYFRASAGAYTNDHSSAVRNIDAPSR
jgi:hypothetical protein